VIRGSKFVYLTMNLLILSAPLLACAFPGQELNEEEQACCRHMAQRCGSMDMSSSHSCCQTEIRQAGPMLQVERAPIAPQMMSAFIVSVPILWGTDSFHILTGDFHPPPESPPTSAANLRI
jgi:hypothetical protein